MEGTIVHPNEAEILDRARAMLPTLRQRAAEIEDHQPPSSGNKVSRSAVIRSWIDWRIAADFHSTDPKSPGRSCSLLHRR